MRKSLVAALSLSLLAGCAADSGAPQPNPVVEQLAARAAANPQGDSVLFWTQAERRQAFANIDRIYPTRVVEAAEDRFSFGSQPEDLSDLNYRVDGASYALTDFLQEPGQIGMLVVKDGDILFERYAPGNDASSRWVSFSVTKSVTSLLIGAAIQDGYIASVDEPVAHYLPRLRGSGYENASIRNVLQMASGVAWNEDYEDPQSDVALAGALNGLELVRYLAQLSTEAAPGETFNYNTGETNLAGEVLRSAIGNNAATYLTHKIWQPYGMTADANWMLSAPGGPETGGCCISATLRDYARIGMFVLDDGVLPDGTRVLPEGWMTESTTPSQGYPGYGFFWWLGPDPTFQARGIFGQQIFIDPDNDLVIAVHSNAEAAVGTKYHKHLEEVIARIRERVTTP